MPKKNELFNNIEKNRDEFISLGDSLFDCPELGFKEFKTAEIIRAWTESLGIKYESEIGVTGIKATIGAGNNYHIAVVSDIDGLPSKNQNSFIHSCGHSIQTTVSLAVMKTLAETKILDGSDVKVSFIFTPAEEFIDFEYRDNLISEGKVLFRSGKQHMIAKGIFDDIDCVISAHANGDKGTLFDINSTLAGFTSKKAVFLGRAAHSGAAPHLGLNALHGAVLCENAIAFIKDQFSSNEGVKINPVITEPGGNVNTIPDRTVLESYIRANDIDTLFETDQKVDCCVEHCAKAIGLKYEIENTVGYMPLKQSKQINKMIKENMLLLCDEEDIVENVVSGASGDVGDLGYLLPTVQFGFSGIEGRFHSDEFVIANKDNCYINTTKIICGTISDLIACKSIRPSNPNFFKDKEFYLKNWLKMK
ncbi:MAG: amidohydrolase [Candidatus Metalachnospira sp.]|nr:amidohydrolase [Candidatus Metalachnospira sp.]